MSQRKINSLLCKYAKKGKRIVRLKGGDPLIFGRCAEEMEALRKKGIEFELIPGITSGIAAAAYAGIPLTHRRFSSRIIFLTARRAGARVASLEDLPKSSTIVIYMGAKDIRKIARKLISYGWSDKMSCAIITRATLPAQQVILATLGKIIRSQDYIRLTSPLIIVIGDVVRFSRKFQWFRQKPLLGKKILLTHQREDKDKLLGMLKQQGAKLLRRPFIEIAPQENWIEVDKEIRRLRDFDWIIFTSKRGVKFFLERMFSLGKDMRALKNIKIATIGPATSDELKRYYLKPDLTPEEFTSSELARVLKRERIHGKNILHPASNRPNKVLAEELTRAGARYKHIVVYRIIHRCSNPCNVDLIVFTSSEALRSFMKRLKNVSLSLKGVKIASLGPSITKTAREFGLKVDIMPKRYTIKDLISAIVEGLKDEGSSKKASKRDH